MREFKFITAYRNEIVFTYGHKKYVGKSFESHLEGEFRDSAKFHLNEAIIEGKLPSHLTGVIIEYLFEEKEYHMTWLCYFGTLPSESDEEIMGDIFGYILGDMPNISNSDIFFKIESKYLHQTLPKPVNNLRDWIFIRP